MRVFVTGATGVIAPFMKAFPPPSALTPSATRTRSYMRRAQDERRVSPAPTCAGACALVS